MNVAPDIKYSMTPPTKEELWYSNEEYDRFEAHYDHQMSKFSRQMNSPIIGKCKEPLQKTNVTKFEFIETYRDDIENTSNQPKNMTSPHPEKKVTKMIRRPKSNKIRQKITPHQRDELFEL